jgi:phosphate transport system substrate-binding protein
MSRTRLIGAACAVALVAAPAAAEAQSRPTITMSGSTTVAPLAAKLARTYLRQYPRRVKFRLAQGGSDVGVADVAAGRVTIGNSSRDPKPSDPGGIFFNKIARDALCIVTNSANRVPDMSASTVQAIFSGRFRDWSQVPGATISGPINVNVRTPASGSQDAFDKIFMGGPGKITDSAARRASSGLIAQAVRGDRNAVGYVSLAFTNGLNDPSYKGVGCTLRDAKSGAYEGSRNLWMVTRGRPTGPIQKFITWVQQSKRAAKVIATEWVPLQ